MTGDTASRLTATIRKFRGIRVAVLGDLVCDEFVYGNISRVSREAPVLILDRARTEIVPGGAGNTVANLRALGAIPVAVGVVGRDDPGDRLLAKLRSIGVDTRSVERVARYETPTKSRIFAGGSHTRRQQIVRLDGGARRGDLPTAVRARLRRRLVSSLRRAEGLLVADYGYGAATPSLLERTGLRARGKLRLPVIVDSRWRVADYRGVTACTPNHEELENAVSAGSLSGDTAIAAAGKKLLARSGDQATLVTRGPRGMTLVERGRPARHLAAYGSGEVADVTGAGDTVIAAFTLGVLAGADYVDAARIANYAAGLVVMKYGTATVSLGELVSAVKSDLAR